MSKLFRAILLAIFIFTMATNWPIIQTPEKPNISPFPTQEFASGHILQDLRNGQDWSKYANWQPKPGFDLAQAKVQSLSPIFTQSGEQQTYRLELANGVDLMNAVALLRTDPLVDFVEPDYLAHLIASPNDPRYAEQWGLSKIQAETAWDQSQGSPTVVIAIIDSWASTSLIRTCLLIFGSTLVRSRAMASTTTTTL